ncbi:MAG TPA: potassium-transporting ATPase subunit KdpC [Bryobacteraceae bacterium]|nr:potassium-transporting ATPase subunit KdpC [Bryobacteraceae bacterium]
MLEQLWPAVRMTLVLTVLTGMLYPALVTGIAKTIFPRQANGSLIEVQGRLAGSELIGQKFTRPEYFHGRPSGPGDGYDAANSGATNLGPTSQKLVNRIRADADKFRKENPAFGGPMPADLLTASASGLDPHISPASAYAQAARVAKARGVSADQVRQLIATAIEPRQLGFLGEPRVNVLAINLALDRAYPRRQP